MFAIAVPRRQYSSTLLINYSDDDSDRERDPGGTRHGRSGFSLSSQVCPKSKYTLRAWGIDVYMQVRSRRAAFRVRSQLLLIAPWLRVSVVLIHAIRCNFVTCQHPSVPPRYPNKAPPRTLWDLVVAYLFEHELSSVALAGRAWCHAVRKRRFRILVLHPHMDHARLVQILRPDTVLPHVRQLTVNGRLWHPGMISDQGQADHRWLHTPALVQLIVDLSTYSPIEFLTLQSLSWGDLPVEVRTSLRAMQSVRALMVHDVDFWTSNQYLMTLNAYPDLQYLSLWHPNFHALTHVEAQLHRTEPLLLTELIVGCSYTSLLLEWLLGGGRREMLAVEELTMDSKDLYRDDARLARVLRKLSPWLKRFYYMEYSSKEICEGACYGLLLEETGEWSSGRILGIALIHGVPHRPAKLDASTAHWRQRTRAGRRRIHGHRPRRHVRCHGRRLRGRYSRGLAYPYP